MMVKYYNEKAALLWYLTLTVFFIFRGTAPAGTIDSLKYVPALAEKYEGLIYTDPNDSLNVLGGLVLAEVRSHETTSCAPRALIGLSHGISKYTGIEVVLQKRRYMNSSKIMRMPFIYFHPAQIFELNPDESINLAKYLYSGGFIMADKCVADIGIGPAEESLRKMFRDILGSEAQFEILPIDHQIYHSFFHFDKGPPSAGKQIEIRIPRAPEGFGRSSFYIAIPTLEGVYLGDRLVAIISDKDYGSRWMYPWINPQMWEAEVKIGINILIYVISQEGSIAQWNSDNYLIEYMTAYLSQTIKEREKDIKNAKAEGKDVSEYEDLIAELKKKRTHLKQLGDRLYRLVSDIRRLQRELADKKAETKTSLEDLIKERSHILNEIQREEDFFTERTIK